jgi:Flp pilus assembly protein TadD
MTEKKQETSASEDLSAILGSVDLSALFSGIETTSVDDSGEMALEAYELAIQLAPDEASLHYHKGQVLEQMGRSAEAEQAYADARKKGYPHTRQP